MRILLLPVLCLLLAGCFGYPEGAALAGDSVAVEVTVTDLATDEVLARNQTLFWQVGDDGTGLGPRLDRAVHGLPVNGTFAFDLKGGDRLEAPRVVTLPTAIAPANRTEQVPAAVYRSQLREEPRVGAPIRYTPEVPGLWRGYAPSYPASVTEVDNETVTFRIDDVDETARVPLTAIGLHARTDGDLLQRGFVASANESFVVRTQAPGQPLPFDLAQGAYVVRSVTDAAITLGHNPDVLVPALQRDVRVEGKLVAVVPRAQEPVDGNLVVRDSPVLSGGGRTHPTASPTPTPADDGHGHTH